MSDRHSVCGVCKYYGQLDKVSGSCRRYPPVIIQGLMHANYRSYDDIWNKTWYPVVGRRDMACGEFEHVADRRW